MELDVSLKVVVPITLLSEHSNNFRDCRGFFSVTFLHRNYLTVKIYCMKRIILSLGLVLCILTVQAYASTPPDIPCKIKEAFTREFPHAAYAKWQAIKNIDVYAVSFVSGGKAKLAYFEEEGTLMAVAQTASWENLPYKVNRAIIKMYDAASVLQTDELIIRGELSYLIIVEDKDERITLRAYANGSCQRIKKEKIKPALAPLLIKSL